MLSMKMSSTLFIMMGNFILCCVMSQHPSHESILIACRLHESNKKLRQEQYSCHEEVSSSWRNVSRSSANSKQDFDVALDFTQRLRTACGVSTNRTLNKEPKHNSKKHQTEKNSSKFISCMSVLCACLLIADALKDTETLSWHFLEYRRTTDVSSLAAHFFATRV